MSLASESGHQPSRVYIGQDGHLRVPSGAQIIVESGGTLDMAAGTVTGGTDTFTAIAGTADPFPISALAAAQGGALTVTAGTSSTSANAGGAASIVGGLPGATGVGGAANLTGAIGGATSGAGGAATVTGGAGTAGNAAGGASTVTGGAGSAGATTVAGGVGGAAGLVAGAGGAKSGTGAAAGGAGGATAVTGGAGGATASSGSDAAGAGGTVTVTGGVGGNATAGTGNGGAGGSVNLVPGTGGTSSGGTAGANGEVQINSNSAIEAVNLNYTASLVTQTFFTTTRAVRVKAIVGRVRVQGSGGACTIQFFKVPSGTAVGSGTALDNSSTFNLVGTVDTNQAITLSATVATLTLAAGDSVGYVLTGTPTSAVGNVTLHVTPI